MNGPAIDLANITVRKSDRLLLDNINLSVYAGELVGLIGPNGAGKTTLLNVIAGFEKFEGALSLSGYAESWKRSREARLRIGYVPQSAQIDPAFPIRASEAVMSGLTGRLGLFRLAGKPEREKAMQLMGMMRMTHLAHRPLGQLSGGERQKVLLARALIQQPDILLMDEPTANLDITTQKEVLRFVGDIHELSGVTVLFVTHDLNMLPVSMRRVVLLNHGRIVFDGPADAGISGTMLSKVFEYPIETFHRNGKRFISYD